MKKSVYLENLAEMATYEGDVGVKCDKYDTAHGLAHDDLARAMYEAKTCPASLSHDQQVLLTEAIAAGEIEADYKTW